MLSLPPVLSWRKGGILLGLVFLLAILFVKPIGVSTQFVIADAILWDAVVPQTIIEDSTAKTGYASPNAYLNKSGGKYAKNAANPLNYSFVFVIAMIAGAFASARLGGDKPTEKQSVMPQAWRNRFGDSVMKRYITVFFAGILVLFGARLAGGCTSGHMMSGMMQTSISGYLFTLGVMVVGIPTALFIYRKKGE